MVPPSETPEWLGAVAAVQTAKMTPDAVERIRRRAESAQRTASLAARSRTLERTSSLSLASFAWSPSLSGYRSSSAAATPARTSMQQQAALTTIESMDSEQAEQTLDSLEASLVMQRASLAAEGLARQLSNGADGSEVPATAAVTDDIEGVLRELREEPADEEECAAKFGVFEGYLSTVEKVRGDTFKFWDDAKAEFGDGARATVEAGLKRLDCPESMGLSDDAFGGGGVWFVQPMARQASKNNAALTSTLASLRTKLELLNRECDCPICLEPIDTQSATTPATTLPCCHRVCQPCWEGWTQARGMHNVFCPLCRHAEFLEFVLAAAPPARPAATARDPPPAGMEID